jgi:hypothetical protein
MKVLILDDAEAPNFAGALRALCRHSLERSTFRKPEVH